MKVFTDLKKSMVTNLNIVLSLEMYFATFFLTVGGLATRFDAYDGQRVDGVA